VRAHPTRPPSLSLGGGRLPHGRARVCVARCRVVAGRRLVVGG